MAAVLRHLSKYVPLCLLFAALLAPSSSCSGSAGRPEAQTPQGDILAASGGPLERLNLPSPAEIERNASVIEAGSVCKGSSFRDDLSHQHVSVDGDDALFDPGFFSGGDPSYSSVAVAIYSLDIGPGLDQLDDTRDINVDGATDLAMGSMHIFAGLPSVSQDHWEWTEMKKKPKPTYTSLNSYSWGVTNSGSMTKRTQGTWLNVCLVIFGDSALRVKRVAITPSNPFDGGVSAVAFRKGWDGKVKGRVSLDGSVHVVGDDAGKLSVSYYDSSASQLYFMELEDRLWTTRAVECAEGAGLFNDLLLAPDGTQLLVAYLSKKGYDYYKASSDLAWTPGGIFDNGDDGSGLPPADVGSHCSAVLDTIRMEAHVFYEDSSSLRIKHAWASLPPSTPWSWNSEFVSPPGEEAHHPVAIFGPDSACCLYISDPDANPDTDNTLNLARNGASGWDSSAIASDVRRPAGIAEGVGFCDGSVFGTDLVCAYSSSGGSGKVNVQDLSFTKPVAKREFVYNPEPGSGAFVDLEMMGDGSVRIVDYSSLSNSVYLTSGDPATIEPFVCLPAVQFGETEDCDDLDFWANRLPGADGMHDAALVTLTSSDILGSFGKAHELKGHVTLIK